MSSFKQLHLSPQLPTTLGQKTAANSTSVVLASDYSITTTSADDHGTGASTASTLRVVTSTDSKIRLQDGAGNDINSTSNALNVSVQNATLSVVQSGTWNIADISGTVSLPTGAATEVKQPALGTAGTASADVLTVQGIASMVALKVDGSDVTQPVSQSGTWSLTDISGTISLPTGAATAANQTTANTSLASIDTKLSGALTVDGSGATQPISATALPLPTGASTAANQTTGNTSLSSIDSKLTHGQQNMAASVPVVIASDQTLVTVSLWDSNGSAIATTNGAVNVYQTGRDKVLLFRNDHTSTSISTSDYTEITSLTSDQINYLYIADTSGSSFKIAMGASGSESDILYVGPGGRDASFNVHIPTNTRLSVKALSSNMTAGELIITGLN